MATALGLFRVTGSARIGGEAQGWWACKTAVTQESLRVKVLYLLFLFWALSVLGQVSVPVTHSCSGALDLTL